MALLAQTTLSHDEWAGIIERARQRFPDLWMPNRCDLCFATTNRQAALKAMAGEADAVVVIGSVNSSNTVALEKVARVLRLPAGGPGQRGLRAARRPVGHGRGHRRRLGPRRAGPGGGGPAGAAARRGEVPVTDEDEYFPPPPELRDLLRGLEVALALLSGVPGGAPGAEPAEGEPSAQVLAADRATAAADVLERMAG